MQAHENNPEAPDVIKMPLLSLMMVIVDEPQIEPVVAFLRERLVRFQFVSAGAGTANSEMLDLLGLGSSEKSVFFCLLPRRQAYNLMRIMPKALSLERRSNGIAFTLPLTSITNSLLQGFDADKLMTFLAALGGERRAQVLGLLDIDPQGELTIALLRERMADKMENMTEKADAPRHALIVAVVNQDSREEVMAAAKAAGAEGGTVINARRIGLEEISTSLGMPLQVKKEIILILTDRKKKTAIMKAIHHDFGLNSPARGLIFSLPVDSVAGLQGEEG